MKRILTIIGVLSAQLLHAQSLSQADYVQLQNQTAYLLTQEYYASFKTLVSVSDGGNYETAMGKMLTKVFSPTSKIWNDYTNQPTTFRDYVSNLRLANRGSGAFTLRGADYRRDASTSLLNGDSLVTNVYVQQTIQDVRGPRTTPMIITLVARLQRDPQNQLGYFYNLRIGRVEKGPAPADAVSFSTDIQDKKNPFATFLAEQTLAVGLNKMAAELIKVLPTTVNQVALAGFTYKNCAIHDVFSTEVLASLQTDLANARQGLQASTTDKAAQGYQVKGSYEEGGNFFKLMADLLDPAGTIVAHVENADLPLSWFAANRKAFIPAEYARIQSENEVIDSKLVSDDRQLALDVNTGRANQVFYKGEMMSLMVRTNKPAFVRALYRNADNQLIWLADKKIENGQTNIDVLLGKNECLEPFGVERLIVVASTEPMCALDIDPTSTYLVNIRKEPADTQEQAVNKALNEALANSGERKCSRGMVPAGSPYKAMKQIVITTKDKVL